MTWDLIQADCIQAMSKLADESVDAICTDPPYGISFMNNTWDSFKASDMAKRVGEAGRYDESLTGNKRFQAWMTLWAEECLRILKPGGHLLAFGGTRTYHRLACAIEDAGFEIRDSLMWIAGSGFPKGRNVYRDVLDELEGQMRAAGVEGEIEWK